MSRISSTCEGTKLVHLTVGWKDFSFYCPKCERNQFLKEIKNVNLTEAIAINLIENFGQAGE